MGSSDGVMCLSMLSMLNWYLPLGPSARFVDYVFLVFLPDVVWPNFARVAQVYGFLWASIHSFTPAPPYSSFVAHTAAPQAADFCCMREVHGSDKLQII